MSDQTKGELVETPKQGTVVSIEDIKSIGTFRVKGVKAVSLPTMELIENMTKFVRFDTNVSGWTEKSLGAKKENAVLAKVTDMETMKAYTMIMPAVVKSSLEEFYPDGGINGHIFAITNAGKVEGKRYKAYEIFEIELEGV